MIKAIEFENFRGVTNNVRIPIRPITLLFGNNAADKGTLLRAMQFAYEIFVNDTVNINLIEQGQKSLASGGLSRLKHSSIPLKNKRIFYKLGLKDENIPSYKAPEELVVSDHIKTAEIELTIGWDRVNNDPFVRRYAIKVNGIHFVNINCERGWNHGVFMQYNTAHPIMKLLSLQHESNDQLKSKHIQLEGMRSAIPTWGQALKYTHQPSKEYLEIDKHIISQTLIGIGEVFVKYLMSPQGSHSVEN